MPTVTKLEREEALKALRIMFPRGSKVHTIERHRSASNLTSHISILHVDDTGSIWDVSHLLRRAGVAPTNIRYKGVRVSGGNTSHSYELVYWLHLALFGNERCTYTRVEL